MSLLPLSLSAIKDNWNFFTSRKKNQKFIDYTAKILQRDDYSCRYCGFKSLSFQQIVNHDQNYRNNQLSNLVTACPFCTQCFFLDALANPANGGGYVIYLPEINQADLNNFIRVLFSCLLKNAPYKGKLQNTYLTFKERGKIVEDLFGPESSNASVFGQTLIDSSLSPQELSHPILTQLRLLPERKFFDQEILYWKTEIFDKIPL